MAESVAIPVLIAKVGVGTIVLWGAIGIVVVGGVVVGGYLVYRHFTKEDPALQEEPKLQRKTTAPALTDPQICAPNHRFFLWLQDREYSGEKPWRNADPEDFWQFCMFRSCNMDKKPFDPLFCDFTKYGDWIDWYRRLRERNGQSLQPWEERENPDAFQNEYGMCVCLTWSEVRAIYDNRGLEIPEGIRQFYDNVEDMGGYWEYPPVGAF